MPNVYKDLPEFINLLQFSAGESRKEILIDLKNENLIFSLVHTAQDLESLLKALKYSLLFIERGEFCNLFETRILSLINNLNDLSPIHEYLTDMQREKACDKLSAAGNFLKISTVDECYTLLKCAVGAYRIAVFEQLKNPTLFSNLIKSGMDLRNIFYHCTESERDELYKLFKNHIFAVINNFNEMIDILNVISIKQKEELDEHIRRSSKNTANTPPNLSVYIPALHCASGKNRQQMLHELQDETFVFSLIQSARDLNIFSYALSFEQERPAFYTTFETRILGLINNLNDLDQILYFLSSAMREKACLKLQNSGNFPKATTPAEYRVSLRHAGSNGSVHMAIINELKEPTLFTNLVKSENDLYDIFINCTPNEQAELYDLFKDHIFKVINQIEKLGEVRYVLSYRQIGQLFENIKANSSNLKPTPSPINQGVNANSVPKNGIFNPAPPAAASVKAAAVPPSASQPKVGASFTQASNTTHNPQQPKIKPTPAAGTGTNNKVNGSGFTAVTNKPGKPMIPGNNNITQLIADINAYRLIRTSPSENKEYLHSWLPSFFQKSKTEKLSGTEDLLHVLKAIETKEDCSFINLLENKEVFRNGRLGKMLREHIKAGHTDSIFGKEVRTVSAFIEELDKKVNKMPEFNIN